MGSRALKLYRPRRTSSVVCVRGPRLGFAGRALRTLAGRCLAQRGKTFLRGSPRADMDVTLRERDLDIVLAKRLIDRKVHIADHQHPVIDVVDVTAQLEIE